MDDALCGPDNTSWCVGLYKRLAAGADPQPVGSPAVIDWLAKTAKAVIIANYPLGTWDEHHAVMGSLPAYVREGGRLIIGLADQEPLYGDRLDSVFAQFGVPWRQGDRADTSYMLNDACDLPPGGTRDALPLLYNMEAVNVRDARRGERLFQPVQGATRDASTDDVIEMPEENWQAAIAGAKVGDGYLVYCGDVHMRDESIDVIATLCGV
ncbi:hypothetical protein BO70DRAFT_286236 [Aspergillus heteromorphus CBS 117.55]|uniref:Uncharacterized protein n=1 Tax=Aspergillus heteromorphus CBS 117.55 TaxID=1448321 RepID=A0A317WS74_9EURO|nr:uncharacterized protein BO70DRAFT_286236 [Aspergillus heteromorphus CBS 117.55]PWY88172.1 hypothetical protein BO70DRAFT_286236 [Aspergillus heteromorphus CBS 117.55]